ncbi:hypothetical protein BLA39750_02655 [Burkholderia lata]|uniref:Uncharacterized protein n=1 Tax=Burkholderia lata (strain ATCC 17760 / DSM 23089 / LMG 22485 / NCIMB 9086 / R18194 / 383) TaxID=482957 RepID=A0A6P2X0S7_BURL3|nr:hypothetical protein [Burkholderia lata]VWD02418.1 hypothetical protein BLA39750_02655 [Burkholderia lata]
MSESFDTARSAGMAPAGSRFPERPACGTSQRERTPQASHDIP